MRITVDTGRNVVEIHDTREPRTLPLSSPEAFAFVSRAWLRAGWDSKYVYTFSWLGRPIIQLPEDMVRIQEAIYRIRPDVIIETGVAHGGSLVFYAGLCSLMGRGRVIGIDVEIRPHNRKAIEAHELSSLITLVEGSSVARDIVDRVHAMVKPGEKGLVILDANHTKEHVAGELEAYCDLVSPGSYIVAADGIMRDLAGAPRSNPDWRENNPYEAAREFIATHPEFVCEQPPWPFNESNGLCENVTYWPGAWLKRHVR